MEITVPFVCYKCGMRFTQFEGGICYICRKPVCGLHLAIVEENHEKRVVCIDCQAKNKEEKRE